MKQKALITSILLGGAGLVAYYFSTLAKTLKNVRVTVFGLKYDREKTVESAFLKIWFDLTLKVENPTDRSVVINEILLDFLVDNKKVGEVKNFNRFVIKEKASTNLITTTYVDLTSILFLVSKIVKLIKDKSAILIKVNGTVKIEGNLVRIDEELPLSYPKL